MVLSPEMTCSDFSSGRCLDMWENTLEAEQEEVGGQVRFVLSA